MDALDASALAPGVGDVTGPIADLRMYARDPEQITPGNVGMSLAGLLPFVPSVAGTIDVPKVYRALRMFPSRKGELYPAMIQGEGVKAGEPPIKPGEVMRAGFYPEKAKSKGIVPRYGIHSGELPYARQFFVKDETGKKVLNPADMVWSEGVVLGEKDLTGQVENMERAMGKPAKYWKMGLRPDEQVAHFMPQDFFYRYDPSNIGLRGGDPWIITDKLQHNRLLSDDEVDAILEDMGRPDLAGAGRKGGRWDEGTLRRMFPQWYE
jgi:hypothetical protein